MIARKEDAVYRYLYGGMERLDEITGVGGGSYNFGARIYDSRLGRFLSIDPLFFIYPDISPFAYCNNNPIMYKEVDGEGFNGGFSIENQSTAPIIVVGNSRVILTDANGKGIGKPVEPSSGRLVLEPGQRLEAYHFITTDSDGNTVEKYTARVVRFAELKDGKLVNLEKEQIVIADADAWDVDYIEVQPGQTFIDEGWFSVDRYNIDPNDKNAKTPNPGTGEGTIKLQPGYFDYWPDEDDANEGKVTITGDKDALKITTGGELENKPKVIYGEGISH